MATGVHFFPKKTLLYYICNPFFCHQDAKFLPQKKNHKLSPLQLNHKIAKIKITMLSKGASQVQLFLSFAMSQFDWPIAKKKIETMEAPQNRTFY